MTAAKSRGELRAELPEVVKPQAGGPALFVCEHASNRIPARYGGLGLTAAARESHAAWDPGAAAVASALAEALDSPLVAARVSRLVYDCNRPPDAESAMPVRSERIEVPGNRGLTAAARVERTETVYTPFCAAVEAIINRRRAAGQPTALVTVHSFTPVWFDQPRRTEIGILHDSDSRLADAMFARAGLLAHRAVARNEPYGPSDGVTHSLRLHGLANALPNVMIEVRNDLLKTAAGRAAIVKELLAMLAPALGDVTPVTPPAAAAGKDIDA